MHIFNNSQLNFLTVHNDLDQFIVINPCSSREKMNNIDKKIILLTYRDNPP